VSTTPGVPKSGARETVHVLSQEGQPYGSTRRCCNHCGVMIWGASAPRHVESWSDWRSHPDNCGNEKVSP
jgi:hypothetical protein